MTTQSVEGLEQLSLLGDLTPANEPEKPVHQEKPLLKDKAWRLTYNAKRSKLDDLEDTLDVQQSFIEVTGNKATVTVSMSQTKITPWGRFYGEEYVYDHDWDSLEG